MQETLRVVIPVVVTHLVALAAIILIVKKMLLSDTMKAMSRIRQVEAEVRKKEEGIRREIEEHEKEFSKKRAEAEDSLQRQRAESEKEVARMKDQIVAEARTESERIIDHAKRGEEKIRQQIELDMEEKAVDYGAQVFKLVFSEKVNSELNMQFIDELLDALEEVDATSITVDASQAEFRSSHAIEVEQKTRLEKLLQEKFSVDLKVQEIVDEKLLAGLLFKLGSLEIDGTLLNRFQEAVQEVKKGAA